MTNITIRIITLNINSISCKSKIEFLTHFLIQNMPDIILLQEVVTDEIIINGYDKVESLPNEHNMKLNSFIKQGLQYSEVESSLDGRLLSIRINNNTTIINLYAPSGSQNKTERENFYTNTLAYHIRNLNNNIIIGGDFNCVLDKIDIKGEFNHSHALSTLVKDLHFTDIWRSKHPNLTSYTFYRGNSASRIDRFYATESFKQHLKTCTIVPCPISDHCMLYMETPLVNTHITYGRGFWKLNISHLLLTEYKEQFIKKWEYWKKKKNTYTNILSWWEILVKPGIKKLSISFSSLKNQMLKDTIEFFYLLLHDLKNDLDKKKDNFKEYEQIKAKIYKLHEQEFFKKQIGIHIHVKIENEKTNLYHLIKSKKEQQRRFINKIKKSDGTEAITSPEIRQEFEKHYNDLFNNDDSKDQESDLICKTIQKHLSKDNLDFLNKEITEQEIEIVIKQTKQKKSPGIDGIPYELYKTFWDLMKIELLELINFMFQKGLGNLQKLGIVVFIQKNKYAKQIRDFRPITLLCSDYKILAKILANRLKIILPQILSDTQILINPNTNAADHLCFIRDLIHYSNKKRFRSHAIINIDFQSAFDLISHKYLFKTLRHFGFSGIFLTCLKDLYDNANTRLTINGFIGQNIPIIRSVRQGCPLSMLLYAIALEPLLLQIRANITGIQILNKTIKSSNYADDASVFVSSNTDVQNTTDSLTLFEQASCAKINTTKSNSLLLGITSEQDLQIEFAKPATEIKVLGVYLNNKLQQITQVNWEKITNKIKAFCMQFKIRELSLIEKSWVTNIFILSKVWYLTKIILPRNKDIALINKFTGFFLWQGHSLRIKRNTLYQDPKSGGLNLIDVKNKSLTFFVKTIFDMYNQENSIYNVLITSWINNSIGNKPNYIDKIENDFNILQQLGSYKKFYQQKLIEEQDTPTSQIQQPGKNWNVIWGNMNHKFLSCQVRSLMYQIINNIIPAKTVLKTLKITQEDKCNTCGNQDTILHRYTNCIHKNIWLAMKAKLMIINFFKTIRYSDEELLFLEFQTPNNPTLQNAAIFLISNTVYYIGKKEFLGHKNKERWKLFLRYERFKIKKLKNIFGAYINAII